MPQLERPVLPTDLTLAETAALVGVKVRTWSSYVARGQAPKPATRLGRTPVWDRDEILSWIPTRPGQGARSTPRATQRAELRSEKP